MTEVKQYSLTPQQAKAKAFIADYMRENGGTAPSYREIADGVGVASTSGVHRVIQALKGRGHLEAIPGLTRAMRILGEVQ